MIWKDIEIAFNGKEARIKPTIEFINYIERRNYSVMNVLDRLLKNTLPIAWASYIISDTFNFVNIKVTPEDIIEKTGGFSPEVINMVAAIITACLPQPKDEPSEAVKKKLKAARKQG